ncbi:extracellular solute-binding protein [Actinomadura xylanilytica]|nr:extracellular solute-binding protein [Actinomadura xylanilytica]MDL4774491.1 extracellular solute-binding protein [Actinomadura xylanilytica]
MHSGLDLRGTTRRHPVTAAACAVAGAVIAVAVAAVVVFQPFHRAPPDDCSAGELTVAGGTDVSLNSQRRSLIEDWNGGDRGARPKARLTEVSPLSDQQHSQLKAVEESGSCAYDVLILDGPWTAGFAAGGFLRPLDDIGSRPPDTKGFFPKGLAMGSYDHRQYALPFNLDVGLLYFRDKAKRPATPDAWPDDRYTAQLGDYEGLTVNALEAVWNHGGAGLLTGTAGTGRAELRDRVQPALEEVAKRMTRSGSPLLTSFQLGYQEQETIEAFARGGDDLAMRLWPYAYRNLANEPGLRDGGRLRFTVAAPPGDTVLGGQTLAISRHSRHAADALALIEYLTGDEAQKRLYSCGGFVPARASVFGLPPEPPRGAAATGIRTCSQLLKDDPRTRNDPDNPAGEPDAMTPERLTTLADAIVSALAGARPRPVTEHYDTFSTTFRGCARKIFSGEAVDAGRFAAAVEASLGGRAATC